MADDPLQNAGETLQKAALALETLPGTLLVMAQALAASEASRQDAARRPAPPTVLAAAQAAQAAPPPPPQPYPPGVPAWQQAQAQAQQTAAASAAAQAAHRASSYPGGIPAWQQAAQPPPPTLQQAQQALAAAAPPLMAQAPPPVPSQQAPGAGAMGAFGGALQGAAAGLVVLRAAADTVSGAFMGLGRAASPTHAATVEASGDLLMARIGSHVLPALEEASRAIQGLARAVPDPSQQYGGKPIFEWLFPQVTVGRQIMDALGVEQAKPSLAALPQARQSTAEAYADRLQMQALNTDSLQTDLLREQVQNMQRMIGLLEALQSPGDRVVVSFR